LIGKIIINRTAEYQSIIGFGGAVTDLNKYIEPVA